MIGPVLNLNRILAVLTLTCLTVAASAPSDPVKGGSGVILTSKAPPPVVLKVEPPNWWPGHSINPVRLLIHGANLAGADVRTTSDQDGLRVSNVRVNQFGTYLFVDVAIEPGAKPGLRKLQVKTASGTAIAQFEVSKPLPSDWQPPGFSSGDVIYLIVPDRFSDGDTSNDDPPQSQGLYDRAKSRYYHGGDFQGIINHLDYIKSLGVTAIWLTPVYDNVNHLNGREQYGQGPITDYHGYGAVDFYGIEEHLGTAGKLRELVADAHRLGIKVIQDEVANHTGPFHPWVKDSPTQTWFNGSEAHHLANNWQIWTIADPHATPETRRETLDGWFINILPDLNQNDPEVSQYLIQNSLWYVGMFGFDAIREDTVPYVPRTFWSEWTTALKRQYPKLTILGEVFDEHPSITSFFQGGRTGFDGIDTGIDTVFDYPMYFALRRAFVENGDLRHLGRAFAGDRLYTNPGILVTFLGLHDVPRFLNEKGATASTLELAQTFLMTARGVPLLYYGDEIAMTGGGDPDNRRDFPGGFPGDPKNAFVDSGRSQEQEQVFDHLSKLGELRRQIAALRRGKMIDLLTTQHVYAYARTTEGSSAIVIINNAPTSETASFGVSRVGIPDGALLQDRLGGSPSVEVKDGKIETKIAPFSAAIYTTR